MKHIKLLAIVATAMLFLGIFTVIPAFASQPPLKKEYWIGTIGQPARMDPARAYDTASGELLQNVYQTLIWWNDKNPVDFWSTYGVGHNLTTLEYSDLDSYEPVLCTVVPTIGNGRLVYNASGSYWRFTIDTTAKFQNWTDGMGVVHPARFITAADVVYSFRRQVVYDSIYSPAWMWMTPAFGYANWRSAYGGPYASYTNYTLKEPADEAAAGVKISNWVYNIGDDVYFHFELPWAEGPMKQIFAQTWGGVVNQDWVKEMGGWDGLFTTGASNTNMAAGWTNNFHGKPTNTRSELDTYKSNTTFPGHGSHYASFGFAACGTGPYKFTSWDTATKTWRIDWDIGYWKGWANAGKKDGINFLTAVISKGIDAWPTRKMLFLEGEFDIAAVPRANMYDLLQAGSSYNPLPGINLAYNIAALSNDVMLYGFAVSGASPYQSYVGYPTHIGSGKPYFFNNTYMRQAFAWALNYTSYVQDAWFGEAILQRSWWVEGLSPASYKNTNASMPQRNLNYTEMQNALNLAVVDGTNVGAAGFEMTLVYNIGNDQRMIACNMIQSAFATLNAAKYKVNVVGLDWPVFLDAENNGYLPMYDVGWLADFADPDNFCEPYQVSWGAFMSGQIDPAVNAQPADQALVDTMINDAMVEPNPATREWYYKDLQYRYWIDVPSYTLIQPVGRRFVRDWVRGWYFNALYPGGYYYDIWKEVYSNPAVDVDATATITPVGTVYPVTEIWGSTTGGGMYLGYYGGVPNYQTKTWMQYSLHAVYAAGGAQPLLLVAIALKRSNSTNTGTQPETQYPNATQVILSPTQGYTFVANWSENGVDQVVLADNALQGSSPAHSGTLYTIGIEAYPVNGFDTNTGNNFAAYSTPWNASRLIGDIRQDGIVNVLDAIKLSSAYGATSTSTNWNANADLNADLVINVLDAIKVSANFGKHVP